MATTSWRLTKFNCKLEIPRLWITFFVIWISLFSLAEGLDTSQCTGPLGMESGEIPDTDLSASSSFEPGNVGPQNGRIRKELLGGAWCPQKVIFSDSDEWIQIELHTVHVITATETQGRFGNGQGAEYAEAYVISYFRPELNRWVRYRDISGNEILKGNINTYLAAKTELNPPIIASKIRILPYSYHKRTVCLRVEIYGCPFRGGLLSYSMPQGSKRGENWNFFDQTYDGLWESGTLRNGLGQLTDGRGGPDNFKDDYYGHERGKGWVGWKQGETKNGSSPVEIVFKFDSVREFSSVHIHSSNQFTKEVQVFSEARVFFSVGGKIFSGEPVVYVTKEDCIFEFPKNITINLHHRIGQHVKLQLFYESKWIMISEVTFDSQPAMGNFTEEKIIPVAQAPSSSSSSEAGFGFIAQSDASEAWAIGNRVHISSDKTSLSQPPPPTTNIITDEWSSATIIVTAVISSFIAIILVLLLILTALLFRHKLMARGKIPPGSQNGTLTQHYENNHHHHLEFGYVAPEDIRKAKGGSAPGGEYQEPFVDPQFSSFMAASNGFVGGQGSSGNSNNGSNGKGKMTEYYSCTLVSNPLAIGNQQDSCNEYEYAVPSQISELGKLLPNQLSPLKSIPNSPVNRGGPRVNLQLRFRELGVSEIPKRNLRMLRKLGDGAFGTVFIGELENGSKGDKNLVAVKHLLRNATEKDKLDFIEECRLLSSLNDPNVTQVLGVCSEMEPYSVILEFLELGDLCQFLKQNGTLRSNSSKRLSLNSLLHIASQISSGMKFLEHKSIVHRDLAARNCVVGRGLVIKVSHFATDTDQYCEDYYKLDGKMPLPIRWMGWESLFLGKYSMKSDVWSFGITLWEILSYCRHSPYPTMNNQEVLHNLRRLSIQDDSDPFEPPTKPHNCPRDVYQLMCDTWQRDDEDRPSFNFIHGFLSRRNINFVPPQSSFNVNNTTGSASSSFVEHYIV